MKIHKVILIAALLLTISAVSQSDERFLHFRVIADSASTEGINVINLVNERTTVTNSRGAFSIAAKPDDLLVLTSVNFEYKRKIIDEADLKKDTIFIRMTPKITQLDEVIINEYSHINAVSLGIVPKNQKKYTQAERKLYAAQTGPIDIIANLLSGHTKMLKKELEVSKKEILLAKMEFLYDDSYYIDTLNIPPDHIKGFQYFLVEDSEFATALKSKNKTLTMFLATKLAAKYKQTLNME